MKIFSAFLSIAIFLFSSAEADTELNIHWLGTSSYLIQFGEAAILTDPFYSQAGLLQVGFQKIASRPQIVDQVAEILKSYPEPKGIFIGHSHFDHLLDTAPLIKKAGWSPVIIGSETTKNILSGFGSEFSSLWQAAKTDGKWHTIAPGIRYKAFLAEHAKQIPGVMFYSGKVNSPLKVPPENAREFKLGKTYAYLFELSDQDQKATIYFTGASTTSPIGFPGQTCPSGQVSEFSGRGLYPSHQNFGKTPSLREGSQSTSKRCEDETIQEVDVAILCVPSWQYTSGYPEEFIRRLKPRIIIPSHYNDFFETITSFDDERKELFIADLNGFTRQARKAARYPQFEKIITPKVNEKITIKKAIK